MNCPKCGCKTLVNENTRGVWSCGTKSWPYCSDVIESVQCLRNQLDEARFEIAKLKAELELIDQEHRSELAVVTAERDKLKSYDSRLCRRIENQGIEIQVIERLRNEANEKIAKLTAERDTLKAACDEFMVWYDSDGSVGGLDNLMFDWRRKVQPEFFTDRATQEAEKGAEE